MTYSPILSTSTTQELHCSPTGFPFGPSVEGVEVASEAAIPQAQREESLATLHQARQAYEDIKRRYDRAVTLCRTQEINRIWPSLRDAKTRWLAAEVKYG
jgi:hypothetical protein